jgi:hypothetical protein
VLDGAGHRAGQDMAALLAIGESERRGMHQPTWRLRLLVPRPVRLDIFDVLRWTDIAMLHERSFALNKARI